MIFCEARIQIYSMLRIHAEYIYIYNSLTRSNNPSVRMYTNGEGNAISP